MFLFLSIPSTFKNGFPVSGCLSVLIFDLLNLQYTLAGLSVPSGHCQPCSIDAGMGGPCGRPVSTNSCSWACLTPEFFQWSCLIQPCKSPSPDPDSPAKGMLGPRAEGHAPCSSPLSSTAALKGTATSRVIRVGHEGRWWVGMFALAMLPTWEIESWRNKNITVSGFHQNMTRCTIKVGGREDLCQSAS